MIRGIKLTDYKELNKINEEELGYSVPLILTKEKIKKVIDNPIHICFVCDDADHKLVGYIHAEIYDIFYAPTMLNILGLAVASTHHRQGIGRKLLLEIEYEAKKRGIEWIRVNSGSQRVEAHDFYESSGYDCKKLQKNFIKELRTITVRK